MINLENNWILESLRQNTLRTGISLVQRNICFGWGGTFGDILDDATGGQWDDMTGDTTGGDPLGDVFDMGEDILGGGNLDDSLDDVLEDITDEAEDALDDPTEPQITYSKNGVLAEVSPVTMVPVVYGTRKIRGINVFRELITESGTDGTLTDEDWFQIYVLSEGEIDGITGVISNDVFSTGSQYASGTAGSFANSGFDTTWNLHKGVQSGELVGYNPFWLYGAGTETNLQWPASGAGVLSKCASIYIKMGATAASLGTGQRLPKLSFIVKGVNVRTSTSSDTTSYSSNPAWILRDYLTNSLYGVGLDDSFLDDASFTAAATLCDVVQATSVNTEFPSGVPTHSCNLIINPAKPLMANVKDILATCSGSLLWVSGKYHLKISTTLVGDVAMAFDTSNIIGGINIVGESKTNKTNQIIAKYINGVGHNSDQAKNWISAELTWPDKNDDSTVYNQFFVDEDNSVPLERKITLKGVTDHNQVRFLAQQACLQSRNNISVSFISTAEALNLLPDDIISITHNTPAWIAKEFRVKSLRLNNNGTVAISCAEYQSSTYTWDHQDIPTVTTDTTLPDPTTVNAPIGLKVSETTYSSIASGGKKIRSTLEWTNNEDYYNENYEFEFKLSADEEWTEAGSSVGSTGIMNDFEKGTFDFRVRAVNSVGAKSDYTTITNQEIEGISDPPQDVTGFAVSNHGSNAILSWDAPTDNTDIDHLQIGILQDDSILWDDAVFISKVGSGNTSVVLPAIDGNYVAKWVDSSGLESSDYLESGAITRRGSELVATFAEQEAWAGTMDGFYETVDDGDDVLRFLGGSLIDTVAELMDNWGTIDELGGRTEAATYTGVKRDLGAALPARVYTSKIFTSKVTDGSNYMDFWGKLDSRTSFDQVEKLANLDTEIRITQDDPADAGATWTAYKKFIIVDVTARGLQLKVTFDQFDSDSQFTLRELELLVDMVTKFESDRAKTATSITYDTSFYAIPDLVVTPINLATGDYMTISSETKTGFGINFYNSSAVAQTRTYNYLARGV
jgi:hypothetical protein